MVNGESRPRVVLGVSGGIAAYKACELLRRFTESGHDVTVVPTAAALEFVGAPTWAALSGKPVSTDVWSDVHEVPHVRIGQQAELLVVAPATADLLAKAAHGLADDLLTNTLLTARCPDPVRAGDAHRDVGAPRHPGQRGHAPLARRHRPRARRGPPDRSRHRQGPAARPGRDLRPGLRHPRPPRRARRCDDPGPGRAAGGGLRRRHPGVPRPGAVHRQPVLGAAGLRPRPNRRRPRRRGHPRRRQRHPARPGRGQGGPRRDDRPAPGARARGVCLRRRRRDGGRPADFRPESTRSPRSRSPTTAAAPTSG